MTPLLPPSDLQDSGAKIAIVLGSGLGPFADSLEHRVVVPYSLVPGLPISKVPGHAGRFIVAQLDDRPILIAQGRVHLYEGWNASQVTGVVRLLHALGIETLILTNAAGSVNPLFAPGDWMMISDHLNLTGQTPLHGGAHFFDMSEIYSPDMRAIFRHQAKTLDTPLHEGVYAAMPGPQYETPAEIRMLRTLGADAVGMSTVPEAIQARALGMRVAGFSCLTNWGAGLSAGMLNHQEVTKAGRMAAGSLVALLRAAVPDL